MTSTFDRSRRENPADEFQFSKIINYLKTISRLLHSTFGKHLVLVAMRLRGYAPKCGIANFQFGFYPQIYCNSFYCDIIFHIIPEIVRKAKRTTGCKFLYSLRFPSCGSKQMVGHTMRNRPTNSYRESLYKFLIEIHEKWPLVWPRRLEPAYELMRT